MIERVSRVFVLNGASSAGKTSIARALQARLGDGWFRLGIDDLLAAVLPLGDDPELFEVGADGQVRVTAVYRQAEAAWYAGVVAVARRAPGVVLDEVLLDGGASQARLRDALDGLDVRWVGVVCDQAVGEERERRRGDRVVGLHAAQRERVHAGVVYDHVVDTSALTVEQAAQQVAAALDGLGRATSTAAAAPAAPRGGR